MLVSSAYLESMPTSGLIAGRKSPPSPVPFRPYTRPSPVITLDRCPEIRVMSATFTADAEWATRSVQNRMTIRARVMENSPDHRPAPASIVFSELPNNGPRTNDDGQEFYRSEGVEEVQ